MPLPRNTAAPRHVVVDALVATTVAFAVYLLLGQRKVYGDGFLFVLAGPYSQPNHPAYIPTAFWLSELLAGAGVTKYEAYRLLSQLGTALGAGCTLAAFRLLDCARRDAWIATGLFALCPSVVFFSTLVEVHGPFLGLAGIAFVSAAWLTRRPRMLAAIVTGVLGGAASQMHAAGQILFLVFGAFYLGLPRIGPGEDQSGTRPLRFAAVMVVAHLASVAGFNRLMNVAGVETSPGAAIGYVRGISQYALENPLNLFAVGWHEWLAPFAPVSVLWLAALWRPELRRLCGLLALALAAYLGASFVALAQWVEHGAYLPPCAWVAAYLTTRALPSKITIPAAVLTFGLAIGMVFQHDVPGRSIGYADGVAEIAAERPAFLFIGSMFEVEAHAVYMPDLEMYFLPEGGFLTEQGAALAIPGFDAFVAQKLDDGYVVLLSEPTWQHLNDPKTVELHPGLGVARRHIEAKYDMRPVRAQAFAGFELHLRS